MSIGKIRKGVGALLALLLLLLWIGVRNNTQLFFSEHSQKGWNPSEQPVSEHPTEVSSVHPISAQPRLERRLPQVIGIAAKKCGTGALRAFLGRHPKVTYNPSYRQEAHFFDRDEIYEKGAEYYRSQMAPTLENEITIENTPRYFFTENVPERIRELYGMKARSLKFIILLCNPIDRLYSDFVLIHKYVGFPWHKKVSKYKSVSEYVKDAISETKKVIETTGNIMNSVENAANFRHAIAKKPIEPLTIGLYAVHLKIWFEVFSREQFLFLKGEQLIKSPWTVMEKVQDFLKINRTITKSDFFFDEKKGFYCMGECLPAGKGRTRSENGPETPIKPLTDEDRNILHDFYLPYNLKLFEMMNQTFEDWNSLA